MARRRTSRTGVRKRTATTSRKPARTRMRRAAAGGAASVSPDVAADATLVTMKQLADRASADSALFEDIVQGRNDVNHALEQYDLRLSDADAQLLETSMATVHDLLHELKIRGWGRWPIIVPFEH